MRLSDLMPEQLTSKAQGDLMIFGVTDDSREVRFGFVFCALPGSLTNGLNFCGQAAARGAQVIVVPQETTDEQIGLSEYEKAKIVVLRQANIRRFYSELVARFYPGRPATIVAVTGTNGKTSTVSFIRDLWTISGLRAVSLGTLGLQSKGINHTNLEASLTTFDAKTLHLMMSQLAPSVTHLAMEASSHALEQGRLDGIAFDVAVYTNFTQDHLDYHRTMDAYFAAKLLLFSERLKADGIAVINIDDQRSDEVIKAVRKRGARLITYSTSGAAADLKMLARTANERGQVLELSLFGQPHKVEVPVAGSFQAQNILAAIGAAVATGIWVGDAAKAIESVEPVPGRLQRAAVLENGASVYVDYAHTPDALKNVLLSLRPHVRSGSKLYVLFGCGGDRDPAKRPIMGQLAGQLADKVFITDDNPRTESAELIRRAVIAGCPGAQDGGKRQDAIGAAISQLTAGDILLVAGKGHEDYQILPVCGIAGEPVRGENGKVMTHKIPFSDQEIIRELSGCSSRKTS